MSGRKRDELTNVSLFPFLAVLICTMGILIVLLVLAVKSAEVNATESAEVQLAEAEQAERLLSDVQDEQLRSESLLALRPDLQVRLARERNKRSVIEENLRQVEERLDAVQQVHQQTLQAKMSVPAENAIKTQANEVDLLKQLIAATIDETNALKESDRGDSPTTYSIVPYHGASGTARQPIYIECTSDGLIIQPGAIRLTERDFTMPVLPGNPLDACLLRIRQYQKRNQLEIDAGQAYPLLVVRPGGESYFALARRAMQSWDDEFGYELVEQEKLLDFGTADERLVKELNETIDESLRNQSRMVAVMESRGQSFQKFSDNDSSAGNRSGTSGVSLDGRANSNGGGTGKSASDSEAYDSDFTSQQLTAGSNETKEGGVASAGENGLDDSANVGGQTSSSQNGINKSQFASSVSGEGETNMSTPQKPPGQQTDASSPKGQSSGNLNAGQPDSQPFQPVAENREENWALPTTTSNAIAYRRPIKVLCFGDRLVIDPGENSTVSRTMVPIQDGVEQSIDQFVQSIWTVIESWGIAGSGGYWKPVLKVQLMPGGQSNQQQLARLLQNSGLEIDQ